MERKFDSYFLSSNTPFHFRPFHFSPQNLLFEICSKTPRGTFTWRCDFDANSTAAQINRPLAMIAPDSEFMTSFLWNRRKCKLLPSKIYIRYERLFRSIYNRQSLPLDWFVRCIFILCSGAEIKVCEKERKNYSEVKKITDSIEKECSM